MINAQRLQDRLNRWSWRGMRAVLGLRYRVRVTGDEHLAAVEGPILVLPNHPAYVDPAIILSYVRLPRTVRPLVYTDTYRHALLRPWMRLWRALEVPELKRAPRLAREQVRCMLEDVSASWRRGDSFLVYPSGRLQRDHLERLGAARAAHDIVRSADQGHVLLVRSRGVWGSMFSCACTGDVPPLTRHIARSLALLLGSGGFAMPRRDVLLTCELVPIERLKGMSREQLNRWLEAWYNVDGGESPHYVPYHRWWPGRAGTGQVANELALLIDAAVPTDASP